MTKHEIMSEINRLKNTRAYIDGDKKQREYVDQQINQLYSQLNSIGQKPVPAWILQGAGKRQGRPTKTV
jgi:hypothetical protein